jgi:hypothetical protein
MKTKGVIIGMGAVNAVVLLCMAAQPSPKASSDIVPKIRTQAIELVDEHGQSRATLSVETNGAAVFRMRDAKGTIRVKIDANEKGSGLLLLDDSTNPGFHVLAREEGTIMTLINKGGRKRVIEP